MARLLGMSKARMRSTLESLFQKMFSGHDVDGGSLGALGNAHGQGVLVDVEHVATLGVERGVAAEVQGDVLVIRVILEDVLAVQGLAVAGDGVHAVEVHTVADDRERVAGEVQSSASGR